MFETHPPVRAFRVFRVKDGKLYPWAQNFAPMVTNHVYTALCNMDEIDPQCSHFESVPATGCRCGFYGYKKRADAARLTTFPGNVVMAEVFLGGKLVEHSSGWRAEQMLIKKIFPAKGVRHVKY